MQRIKRHANGKKCIPYGYFVVRFWSKTRKTWQSEREQCVHSYHSKWQRQKPKSITSTFLCRMLFLAKKNRAFIPIFFSLSSSERCKNKQNNKKEERNRKKRAFIPIFIHASLSRTLTRLFVF
jgi:hypothetical protein